MKTYMPLNGLRWSRNSGSANCDMPQSAVFGRPGGGILPIFTILICWACIPLCLKLIPWFIAQKDLLPNPMPIRTK